MTCTDNQQKKMVSYIELTLIRNTVAIKQLETLHFISISKQFQLLIWSRNGFFFFPLK